MSTILSLTAGLTISSILGAKTGSKRPAQTVAGAYQDLPLGAAVGKKVRLTPSQVAIAKKLGVPLEEYAKYVKE